MVVFRCVRAERDTPYAATVTTLPNALGSKHSMRHVDSDSDDERTGLISGTAAARNPALSLLTFSTLAYFSVCGGPFGLELAVGAAGPGRVVCALLTLAFLWALPVALMTAELSSALPSSSGYMHWVRALPAAPAPPCERVACARAGGPRARSSLRCTQWLVRHDQQLRRLLDVPVDVLRLYAPPSARAACTKHHRRMCCALCCRP